MALYTISDPHLPIGIDKPMDIFGGKWENYVERLKENWNKIVTEEDTVVIGGDISWATYLEQSIPDFQYIQALPGKKIILKGNHDYWWTTMSKLKKFKEEQGFSSIEFLQNNSFMYNNTAICGTRGWSYVGQGTANEEDIRIYEREVGRFELSLKDAKSKNPERIIAFFHYPPITKEFCENSFTRLMREYNVSLCVYGHLHNAYYKNVCEGDYNGIKFMLVSCDYRSFCPVKLCD